VLQAVRAALLATVTTTWNSVPSEGSRSKKKIVRVVEIGNGAGPGIVVNAAEAGEKQERGEIVGCGVANFLAAFLRSRWETVFEPIGETFAQGLFERKPGP